MKAKRTLALFLPAVLALCAFGRAPAPRAAVSPDVLFQFLTVVNTDGSAEFHYDLHYSEKQVKKDLDTGGYSEDKICAETTKNLESSIGTFTQEKHGKEIWCTYSMTFDNLQGLSNHLEDDFSVNVRRLEIKDGKFYLDLAWSSFPCTTTDPALFSCEWAVRAPGKPGANNATRVDGNTLLWDMSASNAGYSYTAESAVGGIDQTTVIVIILLLCCCCSGVIVIAAGAGVFFYLRRKNHPAGGNFQPAPEGGASPATTPKL